MRNSSVARFEASDERSFIDALAAEFMAMMAHLWLWRPDPPAIGLERKGQNPRRWFLQNHLRGPGVLNAACLNWSSSARSPSSGRSRVLNENGGNACGCKPAATQADAKVWLAAIRMASV